MEKWYKIAGLKVKMDTRGRVEYLAIPYEIEPEEHADIEIYPDREEARRRSPDIAEIFVEAYATYRIFFKELTKHEGLLIHSSAIVANGKAYLFTADPGTGKSTHTKIWRKVFGDEKIRILNDDKPAIRCENGEWFAYGTPWSGKSDCNLNLRVPLGGICLLRRGEQNTIRRADNKTAIAGLFKQTMHPKEPEFRIRVLSLLDKLLKEIPVWEMYCNMEPEAAIVAYESMCGEKRRKD